MARGRQQHDDFHDDAGDSGTSESPMPADAPATPMAPVDAEAMKALWEESRAANSVLMNEYLQSKAAEISRERDLKARTELYSKTAQERTQMEADRRWGAELQQGARRFRVAIPSDKSQPAIEIPARTPEEAWGKYMALCGIRSTEHEWKATPAGN